MAMSLDVSKEAVRIATEFLEASDQCYSGGWTLDPSDIPRLAVSIQDFARAENRRLVALLHRARVVMSWDECSTHTCCEQTDEYDAVNAAIATLPKEHA